MNCSMLSLLCQVLMVTCISEAVEQCGFDTDAGRVLVCGAGTRPCLKTTYRREDEEYGIIIVSTALVNFRGSYDVHAYRLCGNEEANDITLADAISRGEICEKRRTEGVFRALLFNGCDDFVTANSNKDLTIYAYEDVDGCNGDLLYRFLLINGTGIVTRNGQLAKNGG